MLAAKTFNGLARRSASLLNHLSSNTAVTAAAPQPISNPNIQFNKVSSTQTNKVYRCYVPALLRTVLLSLFGLDECNVVLVDFHQQRMARC